MANSGKLIDYLGYGTHAARAATPPVGTGVSALYRETDTGHTFNWDGSAWIQIDGGLSNPMTTQDDIIVGGASGAPARLGKGSDGQVLTVDPSTHHLLWATPTSGGSITQLADTTVSGSVAANINLTSISGAYNHLLLITSLRTDTANNVDDVLVQMNADTGANYSWQRNSAQASAPAYGNANGDTNLHIARASGGAAPSGDFAGAIITIPNYAGTTPHKFVVGSAGLRYDTTHLYTDNTAGAWLATAAITSVKLTPGSGNWAIGSRATLYGLL